jgi:hypothetical protein
LKERKPKLVKKRKLKGYANGRNWKNSVSDGKRKE